MELELENVTPLFIAGADQKTIENEGLRTPSLRGLLRWWFRAIMGGIVSIDDLKEFEKEIFGSTEQKSSVRILSLVEEAPLLISRLPAISNELRYLWFSIFMQEKQRQRLQFYSPGTKFSITLSSENKNNLKIALGCLWTLVYLGGIGARMRRGAGSLKVNKVSINTPYEFIFTGNTVDEAKKFIEENLTKIFKDFKGYAGERYNPQTNLNFAVLSKDHARIILTKNMNEWKNLLSEIGDKYIKFRRGKELKYRYTLGLPITAYNEFKDLRHASPLLIGVMDLNGKYAIRLVKFYTSIHPKFSQKLKFLEKDLNDLDSKVAEEKKLGEVEIEIPEVS